MKRVRAGRMSRSIVGEVREVSKLGIQEYLLKVLYYDRWYQMSGELAARRSRTMYDMSCPCLI